MLFYVHDKGNVLPANLFCHVGNNLLLADFNYISFGKYTNSVIFKPGSENIF